MAQYRYSDKKSSRNNTIITIVGSGSVLGVSALCICGASSAVDVIRQNTDAALVLAAEATTSTPVTDEEENVVEWTSDQTSWMIENKITYNSEGLPVDIYGNVVDDPTTDVDETLLELDKLLTEDTEDEFADLDLDELIEDEETETEDTLGEATAWTDGLDWIQVDSEGRYYYVVVKGDNLTQISRKAGFELDELGIYNGISNYNIISVGQKIYFPTEGPSDADNTNLGLG